VLRGAYESGKKRASRSWRLARVSQIEQKAEDMTDANGRGSNNYRWMVFVVGQILTGNIFGI
jgi:hypothetical protein